MVYINYCMYINKKRNLARFMYHCVKTCYDRGSKRNRMLLNIVTSPNCYGHTGQYYIIKVTQ